MPGNLDGAESCVEESKPISSESFGRLQSLAAVFSSPALSALANVPSPSLSALSAVLTRVRHAELPPLRTSGQGSIVEDIVVEVDKLSINLQVADAPIKRIHWKRVSSRQSSKLERSSEVKQSVTGVEEGGALLAGGNLGPVGTLPVRSQLGTVLQRELGVAVVEYKHRSPAMSS